MKRNILLIALVVCTLQTPLPAQKKLTKTKQPTIKINPLLTAIDQVHVVVEPGEIGIQTPFEWEKVRVRIAKQLTKAGIKVAKKINRAPKVRRQKRLVLRIEIDKLQFEQIPKHLFRIATSFSTEIYLQKKPPHLLELDVWATTGTVKAAVERKRFIAIMKLAMLQADEFIEAYFDANPDKKPAADSQKSTSLSKASTKPKTESKIKPIVRQMYFASSKNSKIFHHSDCIWATRIAPKNLVTYKDRSQAVAANKRPCKTCKP